MHKSFLSLAILATLFAGCVTTPPPLNQSEADPSNPSALEASAPRFRPNLVASTQTYLDPSAGQGAEKMDMSKMQGNGGMQGMGQMKGMDHSKMEGMDKKPAAGAPVGMQGMDHSKMPGMEAKQPAAESSPARPDEMQGMDHSKMPGMGAQPSAAASSPANSKAVEMEMKKTSDEMKKLSDELKAKSDATENSGDKPQAAAKSPAVIYTCVMHPQVKEAKPGSCPICGMTLVKKDTQQEAKP